MLKWIAIILALLSLSTASAETDDRLRVYLQSLNDPEALHISLAGEYTIESLPELLLDEDAELTLSEQDGRVWLRTGGARLDLGEAVTLERRSGGLYMEETEKDNAYNGDLTVSAHSGKLRPVLSIGVEEYLYGVVAYEMSNSFPLEALKAQAVAARTYALQKRSASSDRDYDVVDTTGDQVFKGFDPEYENVIEAVNATCGTVGMYNGAYAACFYTASNGGEIATPADVWGGEGDYGYIQRKSDPYDLGNPRSLVNSISFKRDVSDCAALKKMLNQQLGNELTLIEVTDVTEMFPEPEGSRRYTVLRFRVTARTQSGSERSVCVDLNVFDQIKDGLSLGLNRADYELIQAQETPEGFTLEMRRFGHGAGMSQRGAQWMAHAHGKTWTEILNFYYPGLELTTP